MKSIYEEALEIMKVIKALKQAQKQFDEIKNICNKIKELENE